MSHPSGFEITTRTPAGRRVSEDITQITRLETDLLDRAEKIMLKYDLAGEIAGVFSLDDLEAKLASDLCRHIGIGVGYLKTVPSEAGQEARNSPNPGGGIAAKTLDFFFVVILAVPTGEQCSERHSATKVLTALRFDILGSIVAGDESQRRWNFVSEGPDVEASSDTMLYYSQVWRVAMQNVGNR